MSRRRWLADGPLALLLLLGIGLFVAIGRFVLGHDLAVDPLVTCQTVATTLVARLSSLGVLLPAGLAGSALIAAALALVHQLLATRRVLRPVLARQLPTSRRLDRLARASGIAGRIDLVDDDAAYTFCYGLGHTRVCLSRGLVSMLDDAELGAVLRHEAHHARHRDPLKILLGRSLASGLYFLPLAGALRNGYLAGKEICADRDASAGHASGEQALARALIKLLDAKRPVWPSGVLAIGALSPTEARLRQLVEPTRAARLLPSPSDWIVSAMVLAGVFGFAHGAAATATATPMATACEPVTWVRPVPETMAHVPGLETTATASAPTERPNPSKAPLGAPLLLGAENPPLSYNPQAPIPFGTSLLEDANARFEAGGC